MEASTYTAQDFKDVRFNVLDIGKMKVTKAFPILERYPEFKNDFKKETGLDNEKVIKYVMLVYQTTILNRTIPDLLKRKREAAFLVGFEIETETRRLPEAVENMFQCQYDTVNELIVRVCRLNNNNLFEQLSIYEEARARQMVKLLGDIADREKIKDIHESIKRLSDDIEILEKRLISEEKEQKIIDALYHEIENIQLGIRPEEIAEAKRHGSLDIVLTDVYKKRVKPMPDIDLTPEEEITKVVRRKMKDA